MMNGLKRGVKFLHNYFVTADRKPLPCEITRVAGGVVWWKLPGTRKAKFTFRVSEAADHIKEITP